MTKLEENIRKEKRVGFMIFTCNECNMEVLIPHYSVIPSLMCGCKKPFELSDIFIIDMKNTNIDRSSASIFYGKGR